MNNENMKLKGIMIYMQRHVAHSTKFFQQLGKCSFHTEDNEQEYEAYGHHNLHTEHVAHSTKFFQQLGKCSFLLQTGQ